MLVGKQNLEKLFPNFIEDIAENGIDLRVGKIEQPFKTNSIGCVADKKLLPEYEEVLPFNDKYNNEYYVLEPHKFYFVTCDREIKIPNGYTQIYLIRSTFGRCGLQLISSVGDNGFYGSLKMGLINNNEQPIFVGKNERIIQALTFENDGTASLYDGVYQNDLAYQKGEVECML